MGRLTAALDEIVKLYEAWGKPHEADEWRTKLLEAHRAALAALPADSPARAGALAQVGSSLLQPKQYAVAEALLRECLAIREKILPDDWLLFNTQSMLGSALAGQAQALRTTDPTAAEQKFAESERLLVSGYEGMKAREDQIPAAAKLHLTEALERLVQLYDAWRKPDRAAEWRKKLNRSCKSSHSLCHQA